MTGKDDILIEFTLIFNKYKNSLFYFTLKMVNDNMLAEDIVQNTFIKLYDNMNRIRNFGSIKPWLYKTARNEMIGQIRKSGKYFNTIDEDHYSFEFTEIHMEVENKELKEIINAQLDLLTPDFKEIYVLREYSGLTYSEIASVLNIDEDLVKSRLYKIRQKLIKYVSNYVTE